MNRNDKEHLTALCKYCGKSLFEMGDAAFCEGVWNLDDECCGECTCKNCDAPICFGFEECEGCEFCDTDAFYEKEEAFRKVEEDLYVEQQLELERKI